MWMEAAMGRHPAHGQLARAELGRHGGAWPRCMAPTQVRAGGCQRDIQERQRSQKQILPTHAIAQEILMKRSCRVAQTHPSAEKPCDFLNERLG